METMVFLSLLIIFVARDLHLFFKDNIGFWSIFRALSLIIGYKFIIEGIDKKLYPLSMIYFILVAYYETKDIKWRNL